MHDFEWKYSRAPVSYPDALQFMEGRVADIRRHGAKDCVWLLEHPPLYTAGTSAQKGDFLGSDFPVYETGRGGQYTYHGPGQRVTYVMLDLKKHQQEPDIKKYIWSLEEWIICTLNAFQIKGERREGRVGIWVTDSKTGTENKIAAIGVRVRHWVTYHGISINLNPDLSHFGSIIPCGIRDHGVTSIHALGRTDITYDDLDQALKRSSDILGHIGR